MKKKIEWMLMMLRMTIIAIRTAGIEAWWKYVRKYGMKETNETFAVVHAAKKRFE